MPGLDGRNLPPRWCPPGRTSLATTRLDDRQRPCALQRSRRRLLSGSRLAMHDLRRPCTDTWRERGRLVTLQDAFYRLRPRVSCTQLYPVRSFILSCCLDHWPQHPRHFFAHTRFADTSRPSLQPQINSLHSSHCVNISHSPPRLPVSLPDVPQPSIPSTLDRSPYSEIRAGSTRPAPKLPPSRVRSHRTICVAAVAPFRTLFHVVQHP